MLNWFGVAVGVILLIAGAVGLAYAAPSVIAMWRVYQMQKKIEASIERAFEQRTADEWAADLDHADPAARARAIVVLANEQDRRMIAPLSRELRRLADAPQGEPISAPKSDDVQQAIDKMGAVFEKMMGADTSSQLLAAAKAMPDPNNVPPLERLLARDGDNELIRDALAACRNVSTASAAPGAAGSQDAAQLEDPAVLGDMQRLRAAQAVASPDDLLRGLHAATTASPMYAAQAVILRECARRPDRAMAEAAALWAASDDPKRRIVAAVALGGRSPFQSPFETMRDMPDEVRVILRKLVEDPVAEVARAGLDAILSRSIGNKDEIRPLSAGRHPAAGIRTFYVEQAYGITEWFDGERDVDALLGFFSDPSPAVRTEAATRISHILDSDDHHGAFDRDDVRVAMRATARDNTAPLLLQARAISILATIGDDEIATLIEAALAKVDSLTAETLDEFSPIKKAIRLKPDTRYIPGLERWARRFAEFGGDGALDELIAACRDAR